MRRSLVYLLFCLLPLSVEAQSVIARSGEHGEFTRLVFSVPANTEYELERNVESNSLRLALLRSNLEFDLDGVFQRINTDRVTAVVRVPGQSAVDISLNCNCDYDVFTLRDSMIVLDFREQELGENPPEPTEQIEGDTEQVASAEIKVDRSLVSDLSTVRMENFPSIGPAPEPKPLIPSVGILRPDRMEPAAIAEEGAISASATELGQEIASTLARAATEGLLSPVFDGEAGPPRPEAPPAGSQAKRDTGNAVIREMAEQLLDISPASTNGGVLSIGVDECTPDKKLEISSWSSANSVLEAMAEGRNALFGEFDAVEDRAARAYVRSLLHFGFGAEARAILQATSNEPDPVLWSLSYLMDGETDPTNWFVRQADCEGYAAFWAAMSGGVKPGNTHYNTSAILTGMENLPSHLRGHLGQHVAKVFSSAGKPDIAKDILRRLERLHGGPTDSLILDAAEVEVRVGNLEQAEAHLNAITALPEADAPRAVTTAVDIAHAKQEPVSQAVAELTAAYATELRDSEIGPDLWQAQLRTLLLDKNYDESFVVLGMGDFVPDGLRQQMRREVLDSVVEHSSDIPFLKYLTSGKLNSEPAENTALYLKISERLIGMGLPDLALDRLNSIRRVDDNRDYRVLRAKALLDLGKPEEAEISLVGLRGENVNSLRAEARQRMGDHSYARELFEQMGDEASALNNAWLSSDWERVAADGDSVLARAARLRGESGEIPDRPSLSYAESLTGDVANARETLRALLDETRIDADE